jgi:CheY-like chemotaxis protein
MGSTETTPMKVLLVDDEFPELELYRLAFMMHGHNVVTAASGTQAVEIFGAERPDAVLVDLILGDMVGTEAIARMREIGDATFFLLSEAEPVVLDNAARRSGVRGFQKVGIPVGEVVREVSSGIALRRGASNRPPQVDARIRFLDPHDLGPRAQPFGDAESTRAQAP